MAGSHGCSCRGRHLPPAGPQSRGNLLLSAAQPHRRGCPPHTDKPPCLPRGRSRPPLACVVATAISASSTTPPSTPSFGRVAGHLDPLTCELAWPYLCLRPSARPRLAPSARCHRRPRLCTTGPSLVQCEKEAGGQPTHHRPLQALAVSTISSVLTMCSTTGSSSALHSRSYSIVTCVPSCRYSTIHAAAFCLLLQPPPRLLAVA
jgi:hypothetical protein